MRRGPSPWWLNPKSFDQIHQKWHIEICEGIRYFLAIMLYLSCITEFQVLLQTHYLTFIGFDMCLSGTEFIIVYFNGLYVCGWWVAVPANITVIQIVIQNLLNFTSKCKPGSFVMCLKILQLGKIFCETEHNNCYFSRLSFSSWRRWLLMKEKIKWICGMFLWLLHQTSSSTKGNVQTNKKCKQLPPLHTLCGF